MAAITMKRLLLKRGFPTTCITSTHFSKNVSHLHTLAHHSQSHPFSTLSRIFSLFSKDATSASPSHTTTASASRPQPTNASHAIPLLPLDCRKRTGELPALQPKNPYRTIMAALGFYMPYVRIILPMGLKQSTTVRSYILDDIWQNEFKMKGIALTKSTLMWQLLVWVPHCACAKSSRHMPLPFGQNVGDRQKIALNRMIHEHHWEDILPHVGTFVGSFMVNKKLHEFQGLTWMLWKTLDLAYVREDPTESKIAMYSVLYRYLYAGFNEVEEVRPQLFLLERYLRSACDKLTDAMNKQLEIDQTIVTPDDDFMAYNPYYPTPEMFDTLTSEELNQVQVLPYYVDGNVLLLGDEVKDADFSRPLMT